MYFNIIFSYLNTLLQARGPKEDLSSVSVWRVGPGQDTDSILRKHTWWKRGEEPNRTTERENPDYDCNMDDVKTNNSPDIEVK